jgi:pimeloyl-ACP methyl ester carboxylesterase
MSNQFNPPYFIAPQNQQRTLPLFIFLPGMDGTGQLLHTQTETLEKAFDVRCLVIPADHLGSWEVLSKEVLALIRREWRKFPKRSVYLCGESFGGCLAMKVALRAPHFFSRILLVNPASSFNQKPFLSGATQFAQFIPDLFFRVGTYGLLPFLASLERVENRDREALLNAMKSVPPKTIHWRLSLLKQFQVSAASLQRLTQPILLLAGTADKLLPSVAEAERLSRLFPNAKKVILRDSGHACLIEKGIKLYELLAQYNFLEAYQHPFQEVNRR